MKRSGRDKRRLIEALCPEGILPIVDVGADHGHVAHALGAIAVERWPHTVGRRDVRWVVSDGLSAFGRVGVAIIAGMGALTIQGILERGPRPRVALLHAPDDPPALRAWLARNGWRIDAERLGREGRGFCQVIRALPGQEAATGLPLHYGPRLLAGADPLLTPYLRWCRAEWDRIATRTANTAPARHAEALTHLSFLDQRLKSAEP